MHSLFQVKYFNSSYWILVAMLYLFMPSVSVFSFLAIAISLHQFFLLFNSIGDIIPVRYLFGAFMCLQFLIGPTLAYNGLDQYQYPGYRMKVTETAYFLYAIPAVVSFIVGLHIFSRKLKGEHVDIEALKKFNEKNRAFPYWLIGIGFISSILSIFLPAAFAFVFVLIGGCKFIGLFILFLTSERLKFGPTILVIGSIISSSVGQGMFHDLLTWLIFAGAVFCLRYKPSVMLKASLCIGFILLAVVIQQLKTEIRTANRQGGLSMEALADIYQKQNEKNEIFGFHSLAPSNVRINQGFIISNIMKRVPERIPFANGEQLKLILEAAFMPRFLAPNKLEAGDREIFMKYSGIKVEKGTSMGLSSVGDAYVNFGILGGCVFMFVLGIVYSEILKVFQNKSVYFPLLILFTPLVFYYPIRPDSELQTLLGHVVKSCFMIFVVFWVFKDYFSLDQEDEIEEEALATDTLQPAAV